MPSADEDGRRGVAPAGRIYLDHAATTPVDADVMAAMLPSLTTHAGNASSLYLEGREARAALDDAREDVADVLSCDAAEVVFTGSGSEAANLAIRGVAWRAHAEGRRHLVTSAVEHHAVLHTVQQLERRHGFAATYLPVDAVGRVDPADVLAAVRDDTALVSVMYANNEVGTVQPVAEIAAALADHSALVHTDAVQAAGSLSLATPELGVDLLSLTAHKVYGPKGVGALYVRRGVRLAPQIVGGAQERNRRAGTENVAGAVGLAAALARADAERGASNAANARMTSILVDGLTELPQVRLTGPTEGRLPNSASFVIEGVDSEALLLRLDAAGIAASSGSACTSASLEPSHVLLAMGIPADIARSSLRLTTGRSNTVAQMRQAVAMIGEAVGQLRRQADTAAAVSMA
ncbi:MAG: cysteine desulfurase family protein [Chloroflexota bacterium]|nr:cysteine desulfurase family protein [Chloroflexota bacterium]